MPESTGIFTARLASRVYTIHILNPRILTEEGR